MAAASAGTIQSGSSSTPDLISSSSSALVGSQIFSIGQFNNHNQQQNFVQQQHQQQSQNVHFNTLPQHLQVQRQTAYVPRVGTNNNVAQMNIGDISGRYVSNNTETSQLQQQPQQSHFQHHSVMLQRQNHPNLPPGWQRLISNNEVIYVSPSGASLRTHGQIRDYLLSPGTCKCGLPCPLKPEYFFDFNSQVPNMVVQISLENGMPSRSSLACLHQRRLLESQQNILQKDAKRRRYNDISTIQRLPDVVSNQNNSGLIYTNQTQPNQMMTNSQRMHITTGSHLVNTSGQNMLDIIYEQQRLQTNDQTIIKNENDKKIGSVPLSKTPPWRKNLIVQQQKHQPPIDNITGYNQNESEQRVPPLPQSHACQKIIQQPPWQEHTQNRFIKTRNNLLNTKKRPNFKDDPTGYLEHQTAILHNSILNVDNSPDIQDNINNDNYININKNEIKEADNQLNNSNSDNDVKHIIKIEQTHTGIPDNENNYNQNTMNTKQDAKNEQYYEQKIYPTINEDIKQQKTTEQNNLIYNQSETISLIDTNTKDNIKQESLLLNINETTSSQQLIKNKNNDHINNKKLQYTDNNEHNLINMGQATTTTIGGQTVTHFPNGMVQIEQNCDNMIPFKPQQQLQLQQQIQQHNLLYRQNQHIQKTFIKQLQQNDINNKLLVSQESPVSSSTTFNPLNSDYNHQIIDNKGPAQVGAVSTSNQSPLSCPSPKNSPDLLLNTTNNNNNNKNLSHPQQYQCNKYATSETVARNTITSVTAGKTSTATTKTINNDKISTLATLEINNDSNIINNNNIIQKAVQNNNNNNNNNNNSNILPLPNNLTNLQLQPVIRDSGSQFIMTSSGQLIVMPSTVNKSPNQVIINSPGGNNIVVNNQQSVVINSQPTNVVNNTQLISNNIDTNANNNLLLQNSNFIVNQTSNIQPVLINNTNILQQTGQNILNTNTGTNIISGTSNNTKMITNNNNLNNVHNSNNQQGTMMQLASHYQTQGFQLNPTLSGITMVNKNPQTNGGQQQIVFQNGQIIQPVNLIGQQLLVPAGLVVTPADTTLLQIQNVGHCGSILTQQGMVLRAQSPQNKNFLSSNGGGQQFIVGSNGQVSPIGQIYSGPVGLVVPHSNSGTFVQQNTSIVQQQQQQQQQATTIDRHNNNNQQLNQNQTLASPPDTTTHSPRSPERSPSEKSGGSDMVQCVSSSEPDSIVSTAIADSAQSPTTTDYEQTGSISNQTGNVYKTPDTKIRRGHTPPQFGNRTTSDIGNQMKPDSHESPTNSVPASAISTTTTTPNNGNILTNGNTNLCLSGQLKSFCIGELVWGAARGHPAWPGKVVNPPDRICTPSDSTWVQWFGGRPNVELVAINTLKSLSEGLEAHHKAQKDTRKSRKLNSQLERAIQEAMAELDRISSFSQTATIANSTKTKNRSRHINSVITQQRTKPIKIAPAPPCVQNWQNQQKQQHQFHHHQQQKQQQQQHIRHQLSQLGNCQQNQQIKSLQMSPTSQTE